ncbi:hypothetical protein VTH82DRAFT_6375 [Thermothelomyces myriococcoides]
MLVFLPRPARVLFGLGLVSSVQNHQETMEQQRGAGSPSLRAPPGFEPTSNEERPSSTTTSSLDPESGLFPLPPARDSPEPPLLSASSPTSGRSTVPEVSSLYSDREKMEGTNALFLGHHHDQVVAMMHKKFQNLLDYHNMKNRKILHLDWIAGNPDDPVKKAEAEAAYGGMSAADRRMSDKVAEMVMKVTHGVKEWDPRVTAPAITPMVVPPPVSRNPIPARALPVPGQASGQPQPNVEHREYASPTTTSSLQSPASSADKGKGKGKATAVAPQTQAGGTQHHHHHQPAAPVIVSSESAQSPKKRTPLPNIGRLALAQRSTTDVSSVSAGPGNPSITGIPSSEPLPASGGPESGNHPPPPEPTEPVDDDDDDDDETYEDEGPIYLAEGVDPFDALIPAHATPAVSAADLYRHRLEYDRVAYAKREELMRTFSFMKDPAFAKRRKESFIYAVRVVAIPDSGSVVNEFTGPRVEDRRATHIAQGGWVVPPLEERVRWREERKRAYRNRGAKPGKYEGLPYPQVQRAMPLKFDWSGDTEPRYYGPAAPVWHETCDPCLEDVYWMVWQLLAGKQFLGFQPGTGFGRPRPHATGDVAILNQNPFKSPSAEALYHSASYPRGKER